MKKLHRTFILTLRVSRFFVLSGALFIMFGLALSTARARVIPGPQDVLLKFGKPKFATLDPQQINILNWNIYKGEKETFSPWFQLLAANQDILILQEMYTTDNVLSALRWTGKSHHKPGIS